MTALDLNALISSTTSDAATRRPPLDPGDYIAEIGEIKPKSGQVKDDPSKTWYSLNVPLTIDLTAHPQMMAKVGQERVVVFDSPFLDVNETGLDWSPGKNRKLGKYRDALGLNTPGQPFNVQMMQGRQIRVKIKHREYQGDIQEDVDAVAKV